jgi:hypothetical protein
MKRSEKIRLIKGLLLGAIELEELTEPEIEIWIQEIGTDSYRHFKTGEVANSFNLENRERINTKIIIMNYVKDKNIL